MRINLILEELARLQGSEKLNNSYYSKIFLKNSLKLIFIMPLTFLFTGCVNLYSSGEESQHEKVAEKHIIFMIKTQETYFLKHKTFFKISDKSTKSKSNFLFSETDKCYGYYTKSTTELPLKISTEGIYSYARQEACGGNWGIELSSYVGGVFAVPIAMNK